MTKQLDVSLDFRILSINVKFILIITQEKGYIKKDPLSNSLYLYDLNRLELLKSTKPSIYSCREITDYFFKDDNIFLIFNKEPFIQIIHIN